MKEIEENSPDIELWLKLIRAEGVGPVTFKRMLEKFGSVERVFSASVMELTKVEGIGIKTAESIARTRNDFNAEKELALAAKHGILLVHFNDPRYPSALKAVYDPPPVLYIKGTLKRSDALAVAIVGSRRCSHYGMEQASRFAHFLSASGFTVVSGMARGIDTAAHRGALSAGARTIAVQGCGLGKIFPPENKKLFEQICENGVCISELPIEYEPLAENFPGRNRIIAGLSIAVIVAEAALRSGALHTAKAALEYDRDVLAIPGRIDSPTAKGVNGLIKQGARLIDSIEDVVESLGIVGEGLKRHTSECVKVAKNNIRNQLFDNVKLDLSDHERNIYDCIDIGPVHVEEIIESTGIGAGKVNAGLISLRLKGVIRSLPGNIYSKT